MDFASAISSIESGGRYDILGPVTRTGDRAYGRYQVMGANVGPWTTEVFGRAMTPQEFLANPQAQDAVFQAKFVNQLVGKYGPEGAARAWFAGEGGMNNPNAKDILGTTVAGYGQKFARAIGQNPTTPAKSPGSVGTLFTNMADAQPNLLTSPPPKAQVPPPMGDDSVLFDPALLPRALPLPRLQDRFARKTG